MSLRLIAHRGLPESGVGAGRNTMADIERAFLRGLDVEVDVWNLGGNVVISHDPPDSRPAMPPAPLRDPLVTLGELFAMLRRYPERRAWLNVKTSFLSRPIAEAAAHWEVLAQIVTFDYAIPDLIYTLRNVPSLTPALRASEYEWPRAFGVLNSEEPRARLGVYVDRFKPHGFTPAQMLSGLRANIKTVSQWGREVWAGLVSPELHWPEAVTAFNWPGFVWEIDRLPFELSILTDLPGLYDPRFPKPESIA